MKKSIRILKPVVFACLAVAMTSLFSVVLLAQDTLEKKPQKVITIKLDMDEDGESYTIDTTIVIDENFDMDEFKEAMKEYEVQVMDMGKCLKEMELELQGEDLEKAMQEIEISLRDVYRDSPPMRAYCRGMRAPHRMDQYQKQRNMFFYGKPDIHREMVRVRPPKRGESLSDVLGDIPMSAVTSYKIKETKNGKRITIEVSDDAMDDLDEDILIWTGDVPSPPPPPPPPKMKRKIFIEKNIEKEEKPE